MEKEKAATPTLRPPGVYFVMRKGRGRGANLRTLLPGSLTRMPTNMRLQGQSATGRLVC